MPLTYVYKCSKCGFEFEVEQRITDPPLKECKECGGELVKVIQPAGFALKGDGWFGKGR